MINRRVETINDFIMMEVFHGSVFVMFGFVDGKKKLIDFYPVYDAGWKKKVINEVFFVDKCNHFVLSAQSIVECEGSCE